MNGPVDVATHHRVELFAQGRCAVPELEQLVLLARHQRFRLELVAGQAGALADVIADEPRHPPMQFERLMTRR